MIITAIITIDYDTDDELAAIQARVPPELTPLVDALLKRVTFTVVQQVESLP